jgi:hypothetical protein
MDWQFCSDKLPKATYATIKDDSRLNAERCDATEAAYSLYVDNTRKKL